MIDLAIDSKVFITNEFDAAMQELDIILNTTNTELIGYPSFGTNFEQFLWQLNPAVNSIKEYIYEKIQDTLYLRQYTTDIDVNILKGDYRMIYNVEINVHDRTGNTQKRVYQFR